MHVVHLSYFYDADIASPEELLARYSTTTDLCAALRAAGVERVSVVQRFSQTVTLEQDGVTHYLIADGGPPNLDWGENPRETHELVARLAPNVVHHHGDAAPLRHLRPLLPRAVLLWQHHADAPPVLLRRWYAERRGFRLLDGVLFSAAEQSYPWEKAGLVDVRHAVYELMEGSTHFAPLPSAACRAELGWRGDPLLLWVGRLNANKDPLALLRGLARARPRLRDPQLCMAYGTDDLLESVRAEISALGLEGRVHLLGRVPHQDLPRLYSAADFFVLGSHEEGSGYALLEALACGLPPVVTNIPSFRRATGRGQLGGLWKPGSPDAFAEALLAAVLTPPDRRDVRGFFEANWSFPALGRSAAAIYAKAMKWSGGLW
jgi:glycosyltransferase involved in cell wall biosynthesis